jgi:hypothetical protein
MDTAKFCGNCGTPFPRSPAPSSSLVNCPQGHIYSAVYEHCPYCPQPEQPKTGDFATRVESQESPMESAPRDVSTPALSAGEFVTRVEVAETVIDAAVTSIEPRRGDTGGAQSNAETRVEPIVRPEAEVKKQAPTPPQEPPPRLKTTPVEPDPSVPPPPPAPRPLREPQTADQPDRRTVVVSAPVGDATPKGKGKIVGWLITYTRNQEGVDYRLRVGFNRIGAHPACDIVIDDETVSGSHAVIVNREGRCLIKDELSRNGTFVNGVEVTEARVLQSYDQVRVGNTTLTYISADRPA